MSTEQIHHINRAAIAMVCGVVVSTVYLFNGGHPDFYEPYLLQACNVILFLIATNTIVEVLHNNGVFDSLVSWLRMKGSRNFLWSISLLTFAISIMVDNLTTVVLMLSIICSIVRSHYQRVIYSCAILVAATLGGCVSVIGDMTSIMLWTHGVVTPTAFTKGMMPAVLTSLVVFNLLISRLLIGRVEMVSALGAFDGSDSYLSAWQKVVLLILGIGGLFFIPTFSYMTQLPPFMGAMTVLALMWSVEGLFNLERNGNVLIVGRHYFRNTEFIGMRIILYYLGVTLGVGTLAECGALDFVSGWLNGNINNVYLYGAIIGALSCILDNVPLMMTGINICELDTTAASTSVFVLNGTYWQLLAYCCSMGGVLLLFGNLAGQAMGQVEHVRFVWYWRHYFWRVLLAWAAGMFVFWLTH